MNPVDDAKAALAAYDAPHSAYEHPVLNFEVARALRSLIAFAEEAVSERDALKNRIDKASAILHNHEPGEWDYLERIFRARNALSGGSDD